MTTLLEAAQQALEALERANNTAMIFALKARIPECGEFAAIAQDLDWAITAIRTALSAPDNKPLTKDETMLLANETAGNHWGNEAHLQRFRSAIEGRHGIHSESATNSAASILV